MTVPTTPHQGNKGNGTIPNGIKYDAHSRYSRQEPGIITVNEND